MIKTSYDFEKEFMENVVAFTGKTLPDWMKLLRSKGLAKPKETTDWFQKEKKMGHMYASLLAGLFVNGGKPVYANTNDLLDAQFKGKEHLRNLYDEIIEKIETKFPSAQILPKKTYVSVSGKREFAAISIKSKEIRLGMDLGDLQFDQNIIVAKSLGTMPRISHMVLISKSSDFNDSVIELMKKANERVNG